MPRGTETILVVDDSPELVDLLVDILSSLGYRVFGAVSAREAIKVSRAMTGTIDLLLTDVVMPEMNGVELASILVQERPGLKVIYHVRLCGYLPGVLPAGRKGLPSWKSRSCPPCLPARSAKSSMANPRHRDQGPTGDEASHLPLHPGSGQCVPGKPLISLYQPTGCA